jgi:hypothetical protein
MLPRFPIPGTSAETRRSVFASRVKCPVLVDIDVERCLECSWLVRLEGRRTLTVVCSATQSPFEDLDGW